MDVKLTNLGEITTNFIMSDFDVYIMNTSGTGSYLSTDWALLGHTLPEKTINPMNEKFVREGKIPRIPIFQKTLRKGIEINASLQNFNADFRAFSLDGSAVDLGAGTGTEVRFGTKAQTEDYAAIRFVSTREDLKTWVITIPKCDVSQNGEQTIGGEENTVQPLLFKSFFNPLADSQKNLWYENVWLAAVSVTADVPPGYA